MGLKGTQNVSVLKKTKSLLNLPPKVGNSEAKYGLPPMIPPPKKNNTPAANLSGIPGYSAPKKNNTPSPESTYKYTPPADITNAYPSAEAQLNQVYGAGNWFMNLGPNAPGGGGGSDNSGGGGGGGGGGGEGSPEAAAAIAKFNETYKLEGAPSWWRGFTPDVWNPESEYMTLVNSVLPFLSPEDQRASAQSLARMYPEFAGYGADANPGYAPPPTEMDSGSVQKYLSAARSQQVTGALEKMAQASGRKKEEFGPGYSYFKQLASTLGEYGAKGNGEGITRTRYQQMLGQLDPMLAESGGGQLGAYGAIAKMLTNPFFTAGQLGNVIFGQANSKFF
jgi:hypothetical protein